MCGVAGGPLVRLYNLGQLIHACLLQRCLVHIAPVHNCPPGVHTLCILKGVNDARRLRNPNPPAPNVIVVRQCIRLFDFIFLRLVKHTSERVKTNKCTMGKWARVMNENLNLFLDVSAQGGVLLCVYMLTSADDGASGSVVSMCHLWLHDRLTNKHDEVSCDAEALR